MFSSFIFVAFSTCFMFCSLHFVRLRFHHHLRRPSSLSGQKQSSRFKVFLWFSVCIYSSLTTIVFCSDLVVVVVVDHVNSMTMSCIFFSVRFSPLGEETWSVLPQPLTLSILHIGASYSSYFIGAPIPA